MTATYDQSGIRFLYPENWSISENQMNEIPRTVSVQSPSGAFWSVDIHPFSVQAKDLVDQVLQAMRSEYEDIEAEPVEEQIEGNAAIGYNLSFWCLDFVVTARVRSFHCGHATYLMMYQAEDRDFEQLEPVFQAMTLSLLRDMEV